MAMRKSVAMRESMAMRESVAMRKSMAMRKSVAMRELRKCPITLCLRIGGVVEDISLGLALTICGKLDVFMVQVKNLLKRLMLIVRRKAVSMKES